MGFFDVKKAWCSACLFAALPLGCGSTMVSTPQDGGTGGTGGAGAQDGGTAGAGAQDGGTGGQDGGTCPSGTTRCAGTCVDTTSDGNNCGSCGHGCSGGACEG